MAGTMYGKRYRCLQFTYYGNRSRRRGYAPSHTEQSDATTHFSRPRTHSRRMVLAGRGNTIWVGHCVRWPTHPPCDRGRYTLDGVRYGTYMWYAYTRVCGVKGGAGIHHGTGSRFPIRARTPLHTDAHKPPPCHCQVRHTMSYTVWCILQGGGCCMD